MKMAGEKILLNEAQQEAFGAEMASWCEPGWIIYLHGDLGAGKTTLVRGAIRSTGYSGPVKSPTFSLMEVYAQQGKDQLSVNTKGGYCHFDLYRLGNAEELIYLGADDYFSENWVCWIEWPEKGRGELPAPDMEVSIFYLQKGRRLQWAATSDRAVQRMSELLN